MALPPDQQRLLHDLSGRLGKVADEAQLIAFMAELLRSLLRRQGDAEFRTQVQNAFIEGLAGRTWPEKVMLARGVVAVVIAKRPEIAVAWQKLHDAVAPPVQRRAADLGMVPQSPDSLPDLDGIEIELLEEARAPVSPPVPPPPYRFVQAEDKVAAWVADILERRLGIFRLPPSRFPSVSYTHERSFFLFEPAFAAIARRFVAEVLMPACRVALERHVYDVAEPAVLASPKKLEEFLKEKRPVMWKVLIERLSKLAAQHRQAEAKIEAARAPHSETAEDYAEVEVPVSQPRVFKVLGVPFRLGKRTVQQRMRVRVTTPTELDSYEREALELLTRFGDIAADEGMELPPGCDFQFMRILLEFDAKAFASTAREIVGLAGHKETSRGYLFQRLKALDETYANYLSDALILLIFLGGTGEQAFGFKELYDVCIGEARDNSALASRRPFLPAEINRRPTELVFQFREALKRRYDEDTLAAALRHLFAVWTVMSRTRFADGLESGLIALRTFPVAFSGDLDEPVFSAIGRIVHDELGTESPDVEAAQGKVLTAYAPILARLRKHQGQS